MSHALARWIRTQTARRPVHHLVDIANAHGEAGTEPALWVSKDRSFNYLQNKALVPSTVHPRTVWAVLSPPERDGRGASVQARFDARSQRFEHRPLTTRSPRLLYSPPQANVPRLCSAELPCPSSQMSHRTERCRATDPKHRTCELDDDVLAHLGAMLRLPLRTNDRELQERVGAGTPDTDRTVESLARYTTVTLLHPTAEDRWRVGAVHVPPALGAPSPRKPPRRPRSAQRRSRRRRSHRTRRSA